LYGFIVGSVVSLGLSITLLAACTTVQIPNSSLFPEIDFASKCLEPDTVNQYSPIHRLLAPLGNADSRDIQNRLGQTNFFVRPGEVGNEGIQHVIVSTEVSMERLIKGKKYI